MKYVQHRNCWNGRPKTPRRGLVAEIKEVCTLKEKKIIMDQRVKEAC